MSKEWNLLLHPSFIDSYLDDLNDQERLEVINYIFRWYKEIELPPLDSVLSRILVNSTIPLLETRKEGYKNGKKGGAKEGNTNAKKKENNQNNGGLFQENNGGLKKENKLNNNINNNNKDYYYHNNPDVVVVDGGFSFDSFQQFFPDGKNSFSHHELSHWDNLSTKEKELIFDVTPRYVTKLTNEGKEKYIKSLKNYMKDGFWNTINQFQSRYLSPTKENKTDSTKSNKIGPDGYPEDMYDWMDKVKFD